MMIKNFFISSFIFLFNAVALSRTSSFRRISCSSSLSPFVLDIACWQLKCLRASAAQIFFYPVENRKSKMDVQNAQAGLPPLAQQLDLLSLQEQEQQKAALRRFWYSWMEPMDPAAENDCRPLTFPPNASILGWWCSGEGSNYFTLVAWIQAADEASVRNAVLVDWPNAGNERFCKSVENDWRPSDRFPLSEEWMTQRI